eukprot:CAMPEP_0183477690 /NCGR_PEP_ID=MMETSP0370-20130417/168626_1 /TAXON_ID=268820 /ORGANISM="Peridinium aciculiferum, Strain PAER-2" /LENGTH=190 /DNA_ID=CAMNT_0025670609 /DNA_START=13 /DNA_END=583 /DNA_ORIENTATION=-
MPRSGLILHADGGALRVAQYLMELRGAAATQGGDLLWLSIVPCSDDGVAILGLDVEHLLSSVKEHAALLAKLRVVSNIYLFSSSVLSLDELPFPPQVQGPFRLAVTPRSLMSKVLEMASAAGMELSPKQFAPRFQSAVFGMEAWATLAFHGELGTQLKTFEVGRLALCSCRAKRRQFAASCIASRSGGLA